jgi:hypothetical protein
MFREAVRAVGRAGLSFQPPGRKKLSSVLLDSIYDETRVAVDMAVRDLIDFGLSICSDGWSNVRGNPIVNVMCMTVNGQFFRASIDASDQGMANMHIYAYKHICVIIIKNIC